MSSSAVSVVVPVSAGEAFRIFTEELDHWWLRGPINYFDSSRALGMRCEAGVGGRIIEVYQPESGAGLELARLTVWEPAERLGWQSSVDATQVMVGFSDTPQGAQVVLRAELPDGEEDRGGSAWLRVAPTWFADYCRRRGDSPVPQRGVGALAVALRYPRPAEAARWLSENFGLRAPNPLPQGEGLQAWIELRAGDCLLIIMPLASAGGRADPFPAEPWIFVEDLETHFATVEAAGVAIQQPIRQTGFRSYRALDLEGRPWTFVQAQPGSSLASLEG